MKLKKMLISAAVCAALLAFLLGGSIYLIHRVSNTLSEGMILDLYETNLQGAKRFQNVISDRFSLLRTIARTLEEQDFLQEDCSGYLSAFAVENQFSRIAYCDAEGAAVTSDHRVFPAVNTDVYAACMRGEEYLSPPKEDRFGGGEMLLFAVPVRQGDQVAGYVSGTVRPDDAGEALSQTFCNGWGRTCVVNQLGNMIVAPGKESGVSDAENLFLLLDGTSRAEVESAVAQNRGGVVSAQIGGVRQMLGFTPIEGQQGWYIFSIVPLKAVSSQSQQIVQAAFVLCLIVILALAAAFCAVLLMRNRSRKQIAQLAFRDSITGGNNWNWFIREGNALMERSRTEGYVLVVTDIDQFKFINDRFGYQEGNDVLRHISQTLADHTKEKELSARYGGDHFVLLLKNSEDNLLLVRLENIWNEISSYQGTGVARYQITLSSGIYRLDGEPLHTAYDRALLALRSVKGMHGNSFAFYNEEMRQAALHEREIENEMHSALRQGEFIVTLQPKFCLADATLVGAEALVRWKHPSKGLIPPDEFIPLFERNGFIVQLDLFVIDRVCAKVRQWLDEGNDPVPISVNISRVHLHNPHFVEHLSDILSRYQIPSRLIEIELTESIFFENITTMLTMMEQLHEIGFVLSMDDFGSGYSSLNLLKAIPVDVLKIDKEFFDASSDDARSRKIVTGVISIARDLNIKVLSEGVETAEQAVFLRNAHCDYVQGYYFSKPLSIEEFEKFAQINHAAHSRREAEYGKKNAVCDQSECREGED